jgi:hypothetical protein
MSLPASGVPPPCLTLDDGSGVWVTRGQVPGDPELSLVCPPA